MSNKTQYMTGLSITMLVLFSGLAIPTLICGINIASNSTSIIRTYVNYAPGESHISMLEISGADRINIDIRSTLYNDSFTEIPIVFSIMDEGTFNLWALLGEPEPTITNSTYYIKSSDIYIKKLDLGLSYDRKYCFIIYNNNLVDVRLEVDIDVIPFGSIIATGTTGALFSIFFIIFLVKIFSTIYFNRIAESESKKQKESPSVNRTNSKRKKLEGQFCQSCGAPITPKDGQYCPNCGASV
ncbi:MAG: zinc ribbon domain-containing protein [Asgard group archaeon]|nr:zinc ribbon domain-containing protein [Asgard group archaeon]